MSSVEPTMIVEKNNLYVENVPSEWEKLQLKESFEVFGPVESVILLKKKNGTSKCKGFVNFESGNSATKAKAYFEDLKLPRQLSSCQASETGSKNDDEERKRTDTIDSVITCTSVKGNLEIYFQDMKVSNAIRKEKLHPQWCLSRNRASTEPEPCEANLRAARAYGRQFREVQASSGLCKCQTQEGSFDESSRVSYRERSGTDYSLPQPTFHSAQAMQQGQIPMQPVLYMQPMNTVLQPYSQLDAACQQNFVRQRASTLPAIPSTVVGATVPSLFVPPAFPQLQEAVPSMHQFGYPGCVNYSCLAPSLVSQPQSSPQYWVYYSQ